MRSSVRDVITRPRLQKLIANFPVLANQSGSLAVSVRARHVYGRIRPEFESKDLQILYFLDWLRTSTWTTACLNLGRYEPWCATRLSAWHPVGGARAPRRCEPGSRR